MQIKAVPFNIKIEMPRLIRGHASSLICIIFESMSIFNRTLKGDNMRRELKANEVLWPSRLMGTNTIVRVRTGRSLYKFIFSKEAVWVSGGGVGSEPVPAVIHGISFFFSPGLWMDRIKKNSFLEFNGIRTSRIKAVTIEAQRKILDRAIGKWPQERGAPWE